MKPVIALIGRPNVGKSTLFNRLTRSKDALVADVPGLTRDRQYGDGRLGGHAYIVVDTGGIMDATGVSTPDEGKSPSTEISELMSQQTRQALAEADIILFLADGRDGLSALDQQIADIMRRLDKPVWVVVNKCEGLTPEMAVAEFHTLGLGDPVAISAAHGDGVSTLIQEVLCEFPQIDGDEVHEIGSTPRIAVVGRPNVGKSTLVNTILGEKRSIVFDEPGTTRDSISTAFRHKDKEYILIDTAGVRRRSRIDVMIEKFSVIKTLRAIDEANVVLLVLDGKQGISDQDASLAGYILERGKAVVVLVNKQDAVTKDDKSRNQRELERKLPFLAFADMHFISALNGTGVNRVFRSIDRAFEAATKDLPTSLLNRVLESAVEKTPPPYVHGRRIKLKFAHQGGRNPPMIIIHGNQVEQLPTSYQRYLMNTFRQACDLHGTPVRIVLKQGHNPYKNKRKTKSTERRGSAARRRRTR